MKLPDVVVLRRVRNYKPRVKQERERKPVKTTVSPLAGSRKEMARRYLSGELIRALSKVERYWRPGFDEPSLLAEGGNVSGVKLFGPGRAPLEETPDFYTLRYKTRGTIIGAESGMFVLEPHQIVMRDEAFFVGVAHLRADGLCCENCAEMPGDHDRFSEPDKHRLPKGETCHLNELLRSPLGIWVTHATMVVKAKDVPDEHVKIALALFDRATVYEIGAEPVVKQARKRGRPKKDMG